MPVQSVVALPARPLYIRAMPTKFILHTDGAAKGNPGPAGIGVVLYRDGDMSEPLAALHEYIGETTNNVAEYRALIRGLQEALLRGADRIEARTDSELMQRQLAGRYKVNSPQLQALHDEARELLSRFDEAKVVHVLRGGNALADKMANQGVAAGKKR
jgi:ribonuclease HI